jgi:hypothetical protein
MADENATPTMAAPSENEDQPAEGHNQPAAAERPLPTGFTERVPESRTQSMLREAIQKVREEIIHHETEAKKHLQQAEQLRKDLRDSLAFLQQLGGQRTKTSAPQEGASARHTQAASTAKKEAGSAPRHHRAGAKKKHAGKKT